LHVAFCIALSACAARRLSLPTDPGAPLPDFAQVHAQIAQACVGVRSMTAELSLSGRAGAQNLRGRVLAGFERPDSMRLEGVAPFGAPVFILAARQGSATLLLPRDDRVVRNAPGEQILGALTGVALSPTDLQAVLTGCVTAQPRPLDGRLHANGWASIDLEGDATLFLERRQNAWTVRAARRAGWQIEYPAWQGSFPQTVRLQTDDGRVDMAASLAQIETNVEIDPAAFAVTVPPDARALTVDELREAGPLRGE
jgi:hypothetical protein